MNAETERLAAIEHRLDSLEKIARENNDMLREIRTEAAEATRRLRRMQHQS